MARVVPSDIVAFIDRAIPDAKTIQDDPERSDIGPKHSLAFYQSLFSLIKELEISLLPPDPGDYIHFLASKGTIEAKMQNPRNADQIPMGHVPGSHEHPVIAIRRLLEDCPDTAVPSTTTNLLFIPDQDYREKLRLDIASVEGFLNARQWKAAMVIAGSVIEAMLCFKISEKEQREIKGAIDNLNNKPKSDPNFWHLPTYVEVAYQLGMIKNQTKKQALLGGEFRNLIHPGRSIREEAECSRGTAYSVVGALFEVIEDLS
jgi:hypothetical protein